jgi:hypothetical protein
MQGNGSRGFLQPVWLAVSEAFDMKMLQHRPFVVTFILKVP